MARALSLFPMLVAASLAAVGFSLVAFLSQDAEGRNNVLQEVAKVTWQFLLVGVLGGFVTYLLQQRQARAAEHAAMDDFRREMLRRTVAVTNVVRRVPLLVGARRSYRTYDDQMRAIIDAYLDLRAVRHEIANLGDEPNMAFSDWRRIQRSMREMEDYLSSVTAEYAGAESKAISELQIQAEHDRRLQSEVWDRLRNLPVMGDMLRERPDLRGPETEPIATRYYSGYMRPYGEALRMMRAEFLRAGLASFPSPTHGNSTEAVAS